MSEHNDGRKPFRRSSGSGQGAGSGRPARERSGEDRPYEPRSGRGGDSDRGGQDRRPNSGGGFRRSGGQGESGRGAAGSGRGAGENRGGFKRGADRSYGDNRGRSDRGDDRRGGGDRPDRPYRDSRGGDDRRGAPDRPYGDRRGNFDRGGGRPGGDRGGYNRGEGRGGFDRPAGDRRDSGGRGGFGRAGEKRDDTGRGGFRRGGDRRADAGRGGDERGTAADREFGDRNLDRADSGPGPERRRGGEGAHAAGGRGADRRDARPEEPALPDDVEAGELDPAVRRDLLSLDKNNAETVARHLVMATRLLEGDPEQALAHARAARQRAGRIAVVRETAGVIAYHAGEWAEALSELRTARRMSGGSGLLAVMADCERGLGRPERAIELGRSDEARRLKGDEATELRIVVAGARMDLGQYDQAVVTLQTSELDPGRTGSAAARLFYAYAEALLAAGRGDEALTWFLNAASADLDSETDAEERADELAGGAIDVEDE